MLVHARGAGGSHSMLLNAGQADGSARSTLGGQRAGGGPGERCLGISAWLHDHGRPRAPHCDARKEKACLDHHSHCLDAGDSPQRRWRHRRRWGRRHGSGCHRPACSGAPLTANSRWWSAAIGVGARYAS